METPGWKVTIDWESDWGGRTNGTRGIRLGTPIILDLLKKYHIQGLFFISTEVLPAGQESLVAIINDGHVLGSHGHEHRCYRDWREAERNKIESGRYVDTGLYRAPKFCYDDGGVYANPKNHVSLLKHMWLGSPVREDSIFYFHPFDIIGGNNPPNLFCRLWYSKPKSALETLERILENMSRQPTQ